MSPEVRCLAANVDLKALVKFVERVILATGKVVLSTSSLAEGVVVPIPTLVPSS
jgi:hypothetical protein